MVGEDYQAPAACDLIPCPDLEKVFQKTKPLSLRRGVGVRSQEAYFEAVFKPLRRSSSSMTGAI